MIHSAEPFFNSNGECVGEIECEHTFYVAFYDNNGDIREDIGPYPSKELAEKYIKNKGFILRPEDEENFEADVIGA